MSEFALSALIVGWTVVAGCGQSRLAESELVVAGAGGDWTEINRFNMWLETGDACMYEAESVVASYSVDGAPLPRRRCGATFADIVEDRTFRVGVRRGAETGEMVVKNLFPGLHAAVVKPETGKVMPGGVVTVSIPPAIDASEIYLAIFKYIDSDDPRYEGETSETNNLPSLQVSFPFEVSSIRAPIHPGHFVLWMYARTALSGAVLSCVGIGKCSAYASGTIGPLPIEVGLQ